MWASGFSPPPRASVSLSVKWVHSLPEVAVRTGGDARGGLAL